MLKKSTSITLFYLLLSITFLSPFDKSALTLLENPFTFKIPNKQLPPDVSYIFADLKFDGQSIQLCELGPCPYAGLTEAPVSVQNKNIKLTSPYWEIFWHYLASLNIPMFRMGGWEETDARNTLITLGGHNVSSLQTIVYNKDVQKRASKQLTTLKSLNQATAAVVFTGFGANGDAYNAFTKNNPNILCINKYVRKFIRKDFTNALCQDPALALYKPKFMICPATYNPDLADNIIKQLTASHFVIKPIGSMCGNGVIMVAKNELDKTLNHLFGSKQVDDVKIPKAHFWKQSKQRNFIIEAYALSKEIYVDKTPYDPTMRLVCILTHNQGKATVHVLGGYWKTPRYGLNKDCSLTEKHITAPHVGHRLMISQEDMAIVKPLCADFMHKLHVAVLEKCRKEQT